MIVFLIAVLALALLAGLIRAEMSNRPRRILSFKAPLSLLFVVVWFLQTHRNDWFCSLILVGLICCLAGDILLAFGSAGTFLMGLVSFLLGHVAYGAAFFTVGSPGPWMAAGTLLVMASGVLIWRWLKPHLGTMEIPVLAYIVVISIMVCGAWGTCGAPLLPLAVRAGIIGGAVLFYLSDIFVARQRFVVQVPVNRVVGLPLYYAAQFLLASTSAGVPA